MTDQNQQAALEPLTEPVRDLTAGEAAEVRGGAIVGGGIGSGGRVTGSTSGGSGASGNTGGGFGVNILQQAQDQTQEAHATLQTTARTLYETGTGIIRKI